jgi:membrane fusion protein, heavy metal efflux system
MNTRLVTILSAALLPLASLRSEVSKEEAANMVILTETGEKNLKIATVEAEETDFEETVFVLGRVEVAPGRRAIVSSRVPGRVLSVTAHLDTPIKLASDAVEIEVRQPGDPPPRLRLPALLSGIVTAVHVVPGQPISPDTALVEITDLSEVQVVAAVPESLFGKLKTEKKARIRVPAWPDREFDGEIAHLGAEADKKSGTLEAAFHLTNEDLALRPGMRAEVSIILSKRKDVMSIPRSALQGDIANRVVYRRHYDKSLKHTFVRVPVEVGTMNDRLVEITAGLTAGDEVVTTGAYSLGFAGKGSVSLKEALDAAHGHEHNEDGTEMTPAQKAAREASKSGAGGANASLSTLTLFSLIANGLLLVLLVIAMARKPNAHESAETPKTEVR